MTMLYYCLAETSVNGEIVIQGSSVTYSASASALDSSNKSFEDAAKVATINSNTAATLAARKIIDNILTQYAYVLSDETITSMINNSLKTTIHPIIPIALKNIASTVDGINYVLNKDTTINLYNMLSIPSDKTLNVPAGLSLTNDGIINTVSNNVKSKSNMVSPVTSRRKNGDSLPCNCPSNQVSVSGTFYNTTTCSVDSYVINTGATGINNGTITVPAGACMINNYGYSVNNGTINSSGCDINSGFAYNNGTFNNLGSSYNYGISSSSGILSNESGAVYNNYGTMSCYDNTVTNAGEWNNAGYLYMYSNFSNSGSFLNNTSGIVNINTDFSNTSEVLNSGAFYAMDGGVTGFSFTNQSNGTLYNTNVISTEYLYNSGTIYNYGGSGDLSVVNNYTGSFNNGTITVGPTGRSCEFGRCTTVSGNSIIGACPPQV